MKKTLLLVTTILALPMAAQANHAGKYYVSLTGEYVFSATSDAELRAAGVTASGDADYDNGYGFIGAFGYNYNESIRSELELSYRDIEGDSGNIGGVRYTPDDAKAFSTMVNGYYNLQLDSKFSPYLGLGIGWAHETEEEGNAFAYQAMAGVDYKLCPRGTIFAGYRYFGTTDFEYTETVSGVGVVHYDADIGAHALNIGYRFSF